MRGRRCDPVRWLGPGVVALFIVGGCFGGRAAPLTQVRVEGPKAPKVEVPFQEAGKLSMAEALRVEAPTEYVLGPGDTVEISLLRHDEFKAQVTISPTGKILYYLVEEVEAAGLTLFQLRDELKKRLTPYIREPEVLVRITEYKSQKVFVLGQVRNPGIHPLRGSTTLVEALSMAGGVTDNAYLKGAYLVRNGKLTIVDFPALLERGSMQENVPLRPNDIIFIPDETERKVFVLGEVNRPTALVLDKEFSLLEAIATAGGFTRDANPRAVLLLRGDLSKPRYVQVDVQRMVQERDLAASLSLEPRDVVYVPSSTMADVERFMARLATILSPIVDLERAIILGPLVEGAFTGKSGADRVIVPR